MWHRRILFGVTSEASLQFVRPLARRLADGGWEVHVVASYEKLVPGGMGTASVKEHHLAMSRRPSPTRNLVGLLRWLLILRRIRPMIVAIGTPKAALLGLLASRICSIPHRVLILHGLRMESSKGLERIVLSLAEALTAKSATIVIPVSASLRARYEELGFARQRPIHVLGKGSAAGVDLVKFRHTKPPAIRLDHRAKTLQGLGLDPAITTIGFVGRITEDKGLATLLGAFRLLKSNSIAAQILFVGPVESRQLRDQIEATEGACYVGPTVDPRPLYESIEILCLPSLREGLPSVVLEAAAYGTPTIGSNATGVRDAVEHGKTGLIVPAKDEGALAEAVTTLIMNSKLRHALGRNARAYVTEFFSEDVVVGLYFQFFERLVRNDSHSGGSLTVSFD